MIRAFIVHKARLVGEMIAVVLRDEPDVQVVGYAQTVHEALVRLQNTKCDVALVSIDLPENGALCLTRTLTSMEPTTKVLIMGLVRSKTAILRCVEEGAAGYVHEEESPENLVKKLRAVHENRFSVSPEVAAALMERVAELKKMTKEIYGVNGTNEIFAELTPREWEVLQLLEKGYSNRDIAEELVIEVGTVKNHVHSILGKFDVKTRHQAALLARQMTNENAWHGENGTRLAPAERDWSVHATAAP